MVGIAIKPGTVAVPEWLTGRFPIDREAVLTRPTDRRPRQWRKVKLSTLSLVPRDQALYQAATYFGRRFISDMRSQGFGLIGGEEGGLLISGPYPHLLADTRGQGVGRHWGQEQTEEFADFLITGWFLRRLPMTFEYADQPPAA